MINYSIVKRSVNANLIETNQAKSRINQAKKEGKTPQPADLAQFLLLHEHEVDGGNEAEEGCKVVPVQILTLEENVGNDGEDDEGYAFLYHLELNQWEGAAVVDKANTVGGYLTAVLKESDSPTESDHTY